MNFLFAFGAIALLFGVIIIYYNRFIRLRNHAEEAWSGIDVQLKKRYNLIPNLVNTVKGYAQHEQQVFENVAAMRSAGINAQTVKEQVQAEGMITQALGRLFAVAEKYPDLQANTSFLDLQRQLSQIETDIENARRYYNGTAREFNIGIESFPGNLIASTFSFKKFDYFEVTNAEIRSVPTVDFK